MGNWNRELGNKHEYAANNQKGRMRTVKLDLNVNGVIEEIADLVGSAAISETLGMQPGDLVKVNLLT